MVDLFKSDIDSSVSSHRPLYERLRPTSLSDIVGQDHLVGSDGVLTRMVESDTLTSLIFWGPPGSGKTTLARCLSDLRGTHFESLSAVFSGVSDLKSAFEQARIRHGTGNRTLLFVDEIHRFNRSQQDSFLPVIEDGTIILIGATTENPSFELNAALLSRARVLTLRPHTLESLEILLSRAESEQGSLPLDSSARSLLLNLADGDGRSILSLAQEVWHSVCADDAPIDSDTLLKIVQRRAPIYDKSGEGHYNLISALHKAVRGSDPDAALYYLSRMLDAGELPLYIGRRLVRMAVEDIGLADPQALVVANAAKDAYDYLGSPEGELALAQACVYMATAPKSNSLYVAYKSAMSVAKESGSLLPPKHILNAPTSLMKDEGYGEGYRYDHDESHAFSGQDYFPESLGRREFYIPVERGFEREIKKRMDYWTKLRAEKSDK